MKTLRKSILIVDDEEDLTWSISRNLKSHGDFFDVICVNSGEEALEILRGRRMDLIISDIRLPRLDGFALVELVRRHSPNSQIIIMTAFGSSDVKNKIAAFGSIYYIEKPFEIHDLRQMIHDALAVVEDDIDHESRGYRVVSTAVSKIREMKGPWQFLRHPTFTWLGRFTRGDNRVFK
jgi:DNA-binding NtrC family response regulator